MSDANWPGNWHGAFRIELRAEAIGLAWRGWPVLPGAYPTRVHSGNADDNADRTSSGPVPTQDNWRELVGSTPHTVTSWFVGEPQCLLVATGTVLNAIEVDDQLGRQTACLLRDTGHPAPIVALPNGRWLFLTTVTDELPEQLAANTSIQWHGEDSWIPLPPTPFQQGVVHWRVKPEVWGWQLPQARAVYEVLTRALDGGQPNAARRLIVEASAA